jgi:hypothetical protein
MKIEIMITEKELREMVLERLRSELGAAGDKLKENDIKIEVKSKQNYKSEWESAAFRACVSTDR